MPNTPRSSVGKNYIMALDQGTTSSRAMILDADGRVIALAQKEFNQSFPQPGWVEHDADEIWTTQASVAAEVLGKAKLNASDLAGVGITNQRETTVIWERASGRPIAPAIVWQDRRTSEACAVLKNGGHADEIRKRTGLLLDSYFSATKIAWLLDNVPGARQRADAGELAFGTIDCWLAWKLSEGKEHVTDATNASRTMLFNLHSGDWDPWLCETLRVPAAVLPRIVDSSGVIAEISGIEGLRGVPLAAMVGDQQAALAGQACFTSGLAKNTYGTGCFLLAHAGTTPPEPPAGLLATVAARRNGQLSYALEGSVFIGGALVQWLRDQLGIIDSAADIEALAASVPDSGGVSVVPAFAGLGAPYWDADARGAISGLTRGSSKAHIARASLEAIALQVCDLVDTMEAAGMRIDELRIDGGAAANTLLMQMQADLLQRPVLRPAQLETTALGAAYLAGLATGVWSDTRELSAHWQLDTRFEPRVSADERTALRDRWRDAVARTRSKRMD